MPVYCISIRNTRAEPASYIRSVEWGSVGELQMQTNKRIYEQNETIISTENGGIREPMISHTWFYVPSTTLLREK